MSPAEPTSARNAMLDEKVVVITGSSRGIGEAVARHFAAQGARIVVNSANSADLGQAVADSLPEAIYSRADVRDLPTARTLVDLAVDNWGRLDIVVNCAGGSPTVAFDDFAGADMELWQRCFETHTLGIWNLAVAATPSLKERRDGSIVNVTSIAGSTTTGNSIPYAVSKAAADQLTRLLAKTLAPEVRVNAVAPGFIRTALTDSLPEEYVSKYIKGIPLKHGGEPNDIAEACLTLARPGFVTGTILAVDGGVQIR